MNFELDEANGLACELYSYNLVSNKETCIWCIHNIGFSNYNHRTPPLFLSRSVCVCLCLSLSVIPFFSLSLNCNRNVLVEITTKSTYLNINLGLVDKIIVQSICSFHHSCSLSLHSNRMNLYESIFLEWVTHINT